jgi:uncharacterized hydrophobic protein (TIGR00271 family)
MSENAADALRRSLAHRTEDVSRMLGIPPESRSGIYTLLFEESDLRKPYYWTCLLSACGIATLGLAQNSPAVIIGAMLLSPLMAPIVAMGLALAIGDVFLGVRSAVTALVSVVASVGAAALITVALPFQETTAEILGRTRPNPLDLGIALLCGLIAAVSMARLSSGAAGTVLPGVAIAVALVPPLCTAGWGLGAGLRWEIFRGAMVLFLTNLAAIVFVSLLFFLAIGMATSRETAEIRALAAEGERGRRVFSWLEASRLPDRFRRVGTLGNRVLVTGVAVLVLLIPLNSGLRQVKREVVFKREAARAVERYLPGVPLLSRQVTVGPEGAGLHLVLLAGRDSLGERVHDLESFLQGRMEGAVRVTFTEVASRAALQEAVPVPPPPRLRSAADLLKSLDWKGVEALWPASFQGDYLGPSVVLDRAGGSTRLLLRYLAPADLDPAAAEVLRKGAARILEGPPEAVGLLRVESALPPLPLSPPPSPAALLAWKTVLAERLAAAGTPLEVEVRLVRPRSSSPAAAKRIEDGARKVLNRLSEEDLPASLSEMDLSPADLGPRAVPSLQFFLRPPRGVTAGGSAP